MEYLKVPNFSGFNQIAICPGGLSLSGSLPISSRSLSSGFTSYDKEFPNIFGLNPKHGISLFHGHFYIVDKFENSTKEVFQEGNFSYIPYFPGHFYYLYSGNGDNGKEFTYFNNSEEIRKLLLNQFQTPLVSFNALNVDVTQEFVPHLTLSNSDFTFGYEEPRNEEICNEILHELLYGIKASEDNLESNVDKYVDVPEICTSLLEELMLDVVSRGERCSLCFITHFPWLKVCRKNNKKRAPIQEKIKNEQMQPRLRGGARTPKFLITDSDNIKKLLTILRSLDVLTKNNDHEKCELATENIQASLCGFCLIRSLIIRSNQLKGRTKIKPIEFLGYDEEYINSLSFKTVMKFYFNKLFNSATFLEDKFLTTWDCTVCCETNASNLFVDFSDPRAQGKDVNYLFSFWDKSVNEEHSEHFNFNDVNKNASVLFFACVEFLLTYPLT